MSDIEAKTMKQNKIKKWGVLAARIVLTVLVLGLIFLYVDFEKVLKVLSNGDFVYLIPIVLLRPLFYFVRGLRIWQILRIGTEKNLPMPNIVGWFFVSCSIGVFTPGGLGDFSLAYFGRRYDISVSQSMAAVFFDKVVSLMIMFGIGIVGVYLYFALDPTWWIVLGIVVISGILAVFVLQKIRKMINEFLQDRWPGIMPGIQLITRFAYHHPLAFVANIALAIVQSLIVALQIWISLFLVGYPSEFSSLFWLTGICRLAGQIPITVSGFGIYEGSIAYVFAVLGIPPEFSLAGILVCRTITVITSVVVICWLFWNGNIVRPKPVRKRVRTV
jgi:uncharacterized protein (TIRG00374 family)